MDSQAPAITDESLAEARKLIGIDLRAQRGSLEITRQDIRRYAHSMGTENPFFCDEEYSRRTRWGGIIAPPTLILNVGDYNIGPGLPGIQWIHGGVDWEWFLPVKVGDVITSKGKLVDAFEKKGRTVPRMIVQVGEIEYMNQRNQLVARVNTHMMRVPRTRAKGGLRYESRLQHYSPEQLLEIEQAIDAEKIRGDEPRYWEDTQVGEEIGPVVYGPISIVEIALLGGRRSNRYADGAHFYSILERRRHPGLSYKDPATGIEDHPHRGHWEGFMAQEVGMPGAYDVGPQRESWFCRLMMDWIGDDAFLKTMGARVRRPNVVGDTTWCKGKVVKKFQQNNERLIECELTAVNQLKMATMTGSATVILPSREVSAVKDLHGLS